MPFKLIVIIFVIIGFAYKLALNIVKYRSANNPTPENLKDVYDSETYEKWKKYSAEHCRLDIISTVVSYAISLTLLATNAYSAFASLFGDSFMLQILAIILIETVLDIVVGTVESYIANMVIEQKYGFNRTKAKTFIFDRIRNVFLHLFYLQD